MYHFVGVQRNSQARRSKHGHLGQFFIQGHPSKQVGYTLIDG